MKHSYEADVVIIGGGLAGIVSALELLDRNKSVCLLERDTAENFGGLALTAFGGMMLVGTPLQKKAGIKDNPDLALSDWHAFGELGKDDVWPARWARMYIHRTNEIFHWIKQRGVGFFPAVQWVEKGLFTPGNSLPRYHVVWGTAQYLTRQMIAHLNQHKNIKKLQLHFGHRVLKLSTKGKTFTGCSGTLENSSDTFTVQAEHVVIASGGVNGDLKRVLKNWTQGFGKPEKLLNGSHPYNDGAMHDEVQKSGGNITNISNYWNYAAGVHHPKPRFEDHGLSLIPPKSALWVNYQGKRMGPVPLVTTYDTNYLIKRICEEKKKYSWQILNWKIARKELAISGAEHNPDIRDRKLLKFILNLLRGSDRLITQMVDECPDFIIADTLPELVKKMNALTGTNDVDLEVLQHDIKLYDDMIDRGPKYFNDDQLRRIAQARKWKGDKLRTCNFQKIQDPGAMPLIAIREHIISRKSLGGIQTDLECRVLDSKGNVMKGLYAVGESAGFGGGGISGKRSLEGTFLPNCILHGIITADTIADGK